MQLLLRCWVLVSPVEMCSGVQLQAEGEAAGPKDTARAARKVWELREQMTQQAAHHRRVSTLHTRPCSGHLCLHVNVLTWALSEYTGSPLPTGARDHETDCDDWHMVGCET